MELESTISLVDALSFRPTSSCIEMFCSSKANHQKIPKFLKHKNEISSFECLSIEAEFIVEAKNSLII